MKGSYQFSVRSKRVSFDFLIKRNITIIKGDSATGKTTLLSILYEYLRTGRQSGYSVTADCSFYVYLRNEPGRAWTDVLFPLHDTVIFIEENNPFIFSEEFAGYLKASGNYFVFVTRSPLKMLPYSIHEIYEIISTGKRAGTKEVCHEFRELYHNFPFTENGHTAVVVTEDSNSGFQFYANVLKEKQVASASGNSSIPQEIVTTPHNTMFIVDGAAFGSLVEDCVQAAQTRSDIRIYIWMPESFEWLMLHASQISDAKTQDVLRHPWDYVDSAAFESYEQYFTHRLTEITKDTDHPYSKHTLHPWFLRTDVTRDICGHLPEEVRNLLEVPK